MSSPSTLPASSISLLFSAKASSVSCGWFSYSTSWYAGNLPASWAQAAALAALQRAAAAHVAVDDRGQVVLDLQLARRPSSSWIVARYAVLEGLAGRAAEVLPHRERRLGAVLAHRDREAVLALGARGRHDRARRVACRRPCRRSRRRRRSPPPGPARTTTLAPTISVAPPLLRGLLLLALAASRSRAVRFPSRFFSLTPAERTGEAQSRLPGPRSTRSGDRTNVPPSRAAGARPSPARPRARGRPRRRPRRPARPASA